ncbi:MAG TPA: prolyl oligopeptidase family serine peptidase [Candidatus Dormibacteraeota bacterium]|nr:prolyl oligopeptidase family serine peptidase [Candidatus Dormibacteraeota bacterium]
MKRALLVLTVLLIGACSPSAAPSKHSTAAHLTGTIGKAAYEIQVPADWNGTLFLYSHGYVAPDSTSNGAQAVPDDKIRAWLLGRHFAVAGSAYSSSGWAIEDAFKDQIALLDYFTTRAGKPKRVIAWGHSLGGIITAGLVQLYPDRFVGAMPMCGVLAGGVATWNLELDAAYAFKTLLAPTSDLQVVHITKGSANLQLAESIFTTAAQSPEGRARLALVAAMVDLPGWFDPTKPAPAATDFASVLQGQEIWESRADFPFAFQYRAELEARAGGNPSWNEAVDYGQLLATSPNRDEVVALYRQASVDLNGDLRALNAGATIKADPVAAAYLERFVSFDGHLQVPVLSVHTVGDGLVIPANEAAYASVVSAADNGAMLRQVFVNRAGHCAFTPAETIAAFEALLKRIDTGQWDEAALKPAPLNSAAADQRPGASTIFGFSFDPSFVSYTPAKYPRPFARGQQIPS